MTSIPLKIALFILFEVFTSTATGSKVVFEKTPDVVLPPFTHEMTMRCSINKSAEELDILVGRDVSRTNHGHVHLLNAIMIYRIVNESDPNKEYLAGITHEAAAMELKDTGDNMEVTGFVDEHAEELGYLQLRWSTPSYKQEGKYFCEVNGMGTFGEPVLMIESVEVVVRNPDLVDLVSKIFDYEEESKKQASQFADKLAHAKDVFSLGVGYNDSYEGVVLKIHDLEEASIQREKELKEEVASLRTEVAHARHIEMGYHDCDQTASVKQYVFIRFQKPYYTAPRVYINGIQRFSENTERSDYYIFVNSLNTTGFNIYCNIANTAAFGYLTASWISLPSIVV